MRILAFGRYFINRKIFHTLRCVTNIFSLHTRREINLQRFISIVIPLETNKHSTSSPVGFFSLTCWTHVLLTSPMGKHVNILKRTEGSPAAPYKQVRSFAKRFQDKTLLMSWVLKQKSFKLSPIHTRNVFKCFFFIRSRFINYVIGEVFLKKKRASERI